MTNSDTSDDFKGTTKKAVDDIGSSFSQAGKDALDAVSAEFKELSSNATKTASAEVKARAEEGRDLLADQTKRFAEDLRRSYRGPQEAGIQSRLMNIVANGVESASDELRSQSLSAIWGDVKDMARRHPGAFVAGSGLLGFAIARFVMASDVSAPSTSRNSFDDSGTSTSSRYDKQKGNHDKQIGLPAGGTAKRGVVDVADNSYVRDEALRPSLGKTAENDVPNKAKS